MASTATCLAYVRAAGKLTGKSWDEKRLELRAMMVGSDWGSAGLPPDNPFTVSFLLDAIHALGRTAGLSDADTELVNSKLLPDPQAGSSTPADKTSTDNTLATTQLQSYCLRPPGTSSTGGTIHDAATRPARRD
jgi:hypothetical protein